MKQLQRYKWHRIISGVSPNYWIINRQPRSLYGALENRLRGRSENYSSITDDLALIPHLILLSLACSAMMRSLLLDII